MAVCDRKTNQLQGLDKSLPLQFMKRFRRPEEAIRRSFEDFDQEISGDNTYTFEENNRPADPIICVGGNCGDTQGTLAIQNSGVAVPELTIELSGDFSDLFTGAFRFFVETLNVGDAGATVQVSIGDDVAAIGANDDIYNVTLSQNAPDFLGYIVDLSQTPDSVTGGGWGQSTTGVAIRIELAIVPTGDVGFSTFDWYPSIDDIANPQLIKLYCLDALSINRTYETIESPCQDLISYASKAVEFSVTVQSETDDLYDIMPDAKRTKDTTVILKKSVTKTVTLFTDPSTSQTYGTVGLTEITADVCPPVDVLVTSQCINNGPRVLDQTLVYSADQAVPDGLFYVARGEYDTDVDSRILVNSDLIGEEICVDYYVDTTGTLIEETDDLEFSVGELYWDFKDGNGRVRTIKMLVAVITGLNQSVGQTDAGTWELTVQVPASDGTYLLQYISNI